MSATTSDTATEVLASPFTINTLTIKNRIVLGPMAVLRPTADGRRCCRSCPIASRISSSNAVSTFARCGR